MDYLELFSKDEMIAVFSSGQISDIEWYGKKGSGLSLRYIEDSEYKDFIEKNPAKKKS